jgi:ubiquinone biosynthesis protein
VTQETESARWPWLRPLVVRVGVNTVTLVLTFLLLSLIRLPGRNTQGEYVLDEPLLDLADFQVLDLILVGLSLAIMGTFVRPVLTALAGSLVIRTYGLISLIISVVVFWLGIELVTFVSDIHVSVPDPEVLWLIVVALVFSLILIAINTLLGLNRPRLDDISHGNPLWHLLDRLPMSGRSRIVENLRLTQVRQIILEYGLDISLAGTPLARFRSVGDRLLGRHSDDFASLAAPAKIRLMLQQLGPTYVKVGQMISSRADVLPEVWRVELDKLQNTVPPFPYEQVEQIVRSELGGTPDQLFSSFERTPLGAASLAQVHRATLEDGREVVVKVQRPNIQSLVRADLGNMEDLARQAERRFSAARAMSLAAMVHEFGQGVLRELDYRVEAYHALRLAEVLEGLEGVKVPGIDLAHSTGKVLTMEFVAGVKATNLEALDAAGVDRDLVARRLVRAMIKQVLFEGFFHGDPHPGNIVIDPATGTISFLDLGLVGELDQARRLQLLGLMWTLRQRDPAGMASAILGLCERSGPVDEASFRSEVRRLVYQHWIYGNADFSRLMTAMFSVLASHHLRLDEALTLAVKALIQAEELVRTLSPELPLVDTGYAEALELLEGEVTIERLGELVKGEVTNTMLELGQRLPALRAATWSWIDQYQRGRFIVTVDTSDLQRGLDSVGSVSRNLTVGLIVAGQLVALALVLAVVLATASLSDDLTTLLAFAFMGFLAFSLYIIRRVTRPRRP